MRITLPSGSQLTRASVANALDQHETAGLVQRWHNWHEPRPSRKRPLFTVTLAGPRGGTFDLATLHEAHAFLAGLVSAHDAWQWRPVQAATAPAAGVRITPVPARNRMAAEARKAGYASLAEARDFGWEPSSSDSSL